MLRLCAVVVLATLLCTASANSEPSNEHAAIDTSTTTSHHELSAEKSYAWSIVAMLFLLMLCIFASHILHVKHCLYFPESLAYIIIGAAAGVFVRWSGAKNSIVTLNAENFFLFLLPPIVFEAGYSVQKGDFFKNLWSILTFAFLGTTISFVIAGSLVYFTGYMHWSKPLPILDALLFGAATAATDTVAVLATFTQLGVHPQMFIMVFGESTLNDAVAIVLYDTVAEYESNLTPMENILNGAMWFLVVAFGSIFVGVVVPLIFCIILKNINVRAFPSLELTMIFISVYVPYLMADGLGFSGIMAIMFCGIVMSHYNYYCFSPTCQLCASVIFRFIAFATETMIFIYLGISLVSFEWWEYIDWKLTAWGLLFFLVARAINIFGISACLNLRRHSRFIEAHQIVMWLCAGERGAVAFCLALRMTGENANTLLAVTLFLCVFTIVVFGASTVPVLKLLREKTGYGGGHGHGGEVVEDKKIIDGVDTRNWFERLDDAFMKRVFRRIYSVDAAEEANSELQDIAKTWYQRLVISVEKSKIDRGMAMPNIIHKLEEIDRKNNEFEDEYEEYEEYEDEEAPADTGDRDQTEGLVRRHEGHGHSHDGGHGHSH